MQVAVVDNDGIEVAPLWYFWGQPIFASDFLLPFLNPDLDCLDQTE